MNAEERYKPEGAFIGQVVGNEPRMGMQESHNHPELQRWEQRIASVEAEINWEKSKFLPSLNVGYYMQTMKEVNKNLFSVVQLGVNLPVFTKNQKAVVRAGRHKMNMAENEYAYQQELFKNKGVEALAYYRTHREIVDDYRTVQLPKAELIFKTAEQQFVAGEIDYLQWMMLNNQAVIIQNNYFEALVQYNQAVAELNYIFYTKEK